MSARLEIELADSGGNRIAALEHVNNLRVIGTRNRPTIISGDLFIPKERYAASQWHEGKSRLLAYLDGVLIAHTLVGPCTDDVSGAKELLKFTSADPLASPLGRRRVQADVTYTTQDQGAIIKARIDAQNTRSDTFIDTATYSFTTGTTRTLTFEKGKPEAEIIAELCTAFDGVDFAIVPFADDGDTKMGDARVWASRGSVLSNIAFEAGPDGKQNVDGFTASVDPTKITTDQRVTGRDGIEWTGTDATTLAGYGTILDSLDALSDVSSSPLLQAYGTQLLEWRSTPRRVVTITPNGTNTFLPVRDFDLADFVAVHLEGGRYVDERAITGAVRVHGWELTRDASGAAQLASLTILPEDQGGV